MGTLGYSGSFRVWCKMHKNNLDRKLRPLNINLDVYQVFFEHKYCSRVVLYFEHMVDSTEVIEMLTQQPLQALSPFSMILKKMSMIWIKTLMGLLWV